jgi:hypothetical protein
MLNVLYLHSLGGTNPEITGAFAIRVCRGKPAGRRHDNVIWPYMETRNLKIWVGAAIAALCVLLAAWLLPLPRLVAGADELAGARIPQVRASVDASGAAFVKAQANYLNFVATHDMTALSVTLQSAIKDARAAGGNPQSLTTLQGPARQMEEYLGLLQTYAEAGEPYFSDLQNYDSTLMAWTRSLGTDPERYRKATFPIADYLRLYPRPVGDLTPDIPWVHASEVASETLALRLHMTALDSAVSAGGASNSSKVVDDMGSDVARVWDLGRGVERIESLHKGYEKVLRDYDAQIQAAASSAGSPTRVVSLASGLNLLVGMVVLLGLAALFAPRGVIARAEFPFMKSSR